MNWPNDADGEVFRSLNSEGFDFTKECEIDFNVDFEYWPPSEEAISLLSEHYGKIEIIYPEEEYDGYLLFRVKDKLTYKLVIQVQKEASALMDQFQGICESWGLFSN